MPERIRSFRDSFRYAFKGIAFCIKNERNMRVHITAAVYVLSFSPFFHLSATQYAILFLTIGLVIFAEALNTAIEAVINLEAQWYDNLARIGKNTAAGAVLVCAFASVLVGVALFWRPATLLFIVEYLCSHLVFGLLFLASLPVASIFIFFFPFGIFRKH